MEACCGRATFGAAWPARRTTHSLVQKAGALDSHQNVNRSLFLRPSYETCNPSPTFVCYSHARLGGGHLIPAVLETSDNIAMTDVLRAHSVQLTKRVKRYQSHSGHAHERQPLRVHLHYAAAPRAPQKTPLPT
eukprot:366546-Chlamydomonas_euryale.AAC.11